jgi:hypothetical protein
MTLTCRVMDELSELPSSLAYTPSAMEERGDQLTKASYESPIANYKNIASHRKAMANNSAWEVKFAVNYFVNRMGVANVQREAGLLHEDGGSFWIRRR